jgi:ferredoxin
MPADEHLLETLEKYDGWMRQGKIPYAGKILPVREAFRLTQWILPTQQAIEILRNVRTFALTECICRSRYQRCDKPLDTCLLTNDMADAFVEAGKAQLISLEEAERVLRKADEDGLVHQTLYNPQQYAFAVCSCCPCCCYRLQILRVFGRDDLVVHADYVAVVEEGRCTSCGLCVERCIFGAREMVDGEMIYYPERCYGCGLCVTVCPEQATKLELRTLLGEKGSREPSTGQVDPGH